MKRIYFIFLLSITLNNLFANTRLLPPNDIKPEEINKNEKEKFQSMQSVSVQNSSTISIPNQYKGKLKYTEAEPDAYLKEYRLFLSFGGQASLYPTLKMKALSEAKLNIIDNSPYDYQFLKEDEWEMPLSYSYSAALGIYWVNGVRLEFEYSKRTIEIDSFAKNFKKLQQTGPNGANLPSVIFNQYLQTSAVKTTERSANGYCEDDPAPCQIFYTSLQNNMQPLVNLTVKSYMLNLILEQVYVKSKFRPFIGFGAGLVIGDMNSLVNNGAYNTFGAQFLAGISYPVIEDKLTFYLGYKGLFTPPMRQTFHRLVGAEGYLEYNADDPTIPIKHTFEECGGGSGNNRPFCYYNPDIQEIEQKFNFSSHSLELTTRFFF